MRALPGVIISDVVQPGLSLANLNIILSAKLSLLSSFFYTAHNITTRKFTPKATVTPDHRFLDRTIGCDWAKMRQIDTFCYDLQQRSHTGMDLYSWSRYHERLENIDGKSHRRKSCD